MASPERESLDLYRRCDSPISVWAHSVTAGMSMEQLKKLQMWFVNRDLQAMVLPHSVCADCGHLWVELPLVGLDEFDF